MAYEENQDSRFDRSWPNFDLDKIKALMEDMNNGFKIESLTDVNADLAKDGQVLVKSGDRWVAGYVTNNGTEITNHGSLTGLDADDHPQYLNEERAFEFFWTKIQVDNRLNNYATMQDLFNTESRIDEISIAQQDMTPESLGAALADHNHDERYYKKSEIDNALAGKADTNHIYSHSGLSDLDKDDHKQYLTEVRGDMRYYTKDQSDQNLSTKTNVSDLNALKDRVNTLENSPDPGVTVHADLTGLNADDHKQYLNEDRGDARYYTKDMSDGKYTTKVFVSGLSSRIYTLETAPAVTLNSLGAAPATHDHDDRYYSKTQSDAKYQTQTDAGAMGTRISNLEQTRVTAHAQLTGLDADDHQQYLTNARGDARYYTKSQSDGKYGLQTDISSVSSRVTTLEAKPNPITSHSGLTGLSLDDHPQYLNNTRGDIRYYTKSQSDGKYSLQTDATALTARVTTLEGKPAPITVHANLTGLAADDHPQYLTLNRAQASFYLKSETDGLLTTKASSDSVVTLTNNINTITNRITNIENNNYPYPLSEYGFHSVSTIFGTTPNLLSVVLGKLFLTRIYVPANNAIKTISFAVKNPGLLPGTTTSGVAIYTDAGVLIEQVQSGSLFTSAGWKKTTLVNTIAAQSTGKFYWVGILSNLATLASIYSTADNPWNGSISGHRRSISQGLANTFPNSFTPGTYGSDEPLMPLIGLGS